MLLLLLSPARVMGQDVISLTSRQGLQNTQIRDLYQDSRLSVWICTQDGLFRHDGIKLHRYYNDKHNPASLGFNYVNCALEYDRDRVLIGTKRGLYEYNYRTDSFRLLPFVGSDGDSLYLHVSSLYRRSDNVIVALVGGYGSYEIYEDEAKCTYSKIVTTYVTSNVTAAQLLEDGKKNMFLINDIHQVYVRKAGKKDFVKIGNISNAVSMCLGEDDNVYMGDRHDGLFRYDYKTSDFVKVSPENDKFVIYNVVNIDNGYIGVCTDGNGLKLYDVRTGNFTQSNVRTPAFDFTQSNVKDVLFDKKSNLWIGIFWKGVFVQPFNHSAFNYMGRNSVMRNTIGTNCVTAIGGSSAEGMWVASDNSGLYKVKRDGMESEHVEGVPSTVTAIYSDKNGNVYIGSAIGDFVCIKANTNTVTNISKSVDGGWVMSGAYAIDEDRYGNIWVAAMGNGVTVYDPRTNTIENFTAIANPTVQKKYRVLDNTYVKSLKVCGNSLMVGTSDGLEVYRIGPRNTLKRVTRIGIGMQINAIKSDDRGNAWIATTGGLMKYSFNNPDNYKLFTMDDGLPSNFVCAVEYLKDCRLMWLSTHYGLCCFDMEQEKVVRNYNAIDGLQDEEFSDNSSFTSGGQIYFGGINGLTYFRPEDVMSSISSDVNVDLEIVDFYVFGKSVSGGQKSGYYTVFEGCVSDVERVDLCHEDNTFSFDVSMMNISTRGVRYEYCVNGSDWVELPAGQGTLAFSNMQSGKYKICIRALLSDVVLAEKELLVCVHDAWYWTIWAKLVYILLLLFGAYSIYLQLHERARAKRILEHHRQNEQLNEARIQFFMNISHEIRTPMTLILSPLEKLMKMDSDEERQHNYRLMNQNAQRILRLINQLMDVRKIEKGEFAIEYTKVEVVSFLKAIFEVFEATARSRKISYEFQHSVEKAEVYVDAQSLDKIVMNLLSNAFKFTPDGGNIVLRLELQLLEKSFTVEVIDTGVGIPDDEKSKVFRRFYSSPHQNGYIGTGIGLNLTSLLVGLHNGSIKVLDNPTGKGTDMQVCLPIGDESNVRKISAEEKETSVLEHEMEVTPLDVNVTKKSGKRYNLIVVDDEVDIRQYIHSEFVSSYNVREFGNGKDAWEYIQKNPDEVDIIISDIMMPIMDGNEMCKRIKGNYNTSHIPVILLSAKASDADRIAGAVIGADAYVTKPFNVELLSATVNNLLTSRNSLKGRYSANVVKEATIEDIEVESPDQIFLEKVNKYISKHMDDPDLSVETIADNIGFSRVHFYRKIKEMTGQTPLNYIKTIRLQQAARLLVDKKMDVTGVSVATGFKTLSTFSTSFKDMYGMTPSEFVKSKKQPNRAD